uniref:Large ribosomal subunit protein mL38 n=1 Tax=Steinernema glaseri TaxID=37863 RepID=A0A1I7ZVC7_9BILA
MNKQLGSVYANLYVKGSHRAKRLPKVARPMRPRVIAWAGPTAFMRNRFYKMDKWYKARIAKPELVPQLHVIEPEKYGRSLEERLEALSPEEEKIDIGFKSRQEAKAQFERNEADLEKMSRKNQLLIDLKALELTDRAIFNHYGIMGDLFRPGVFFHITQKMDVSFGDESSVFYGNCLAPGATGSAPSVQLESFGSDAFNTVVMLNLDGNAYTSKEGKQLVHWVVSNVPDSGDLNAGEVVVPYLQPLPYKGTGFHRIVFLNFRHRERIDLSGFALKGSDLSDRLFSMNEFFKTHEDKLTPSALKFFQTEWDESCQSVVQSKGFDMPTYNYEFNETYKPEQREFPLKPQPFNLYLDMYRKPESVRAEVEKRRLTMLLNNGSVEKPKYPDIDYAENKKKLPHWQHDKLMKDNSGIGPGAALWRDSAQ